MKLVDNVPSVLQMSGCLPGTASWIIVPLPFDLVHQSRLLTTRFQLRPEDLIDLGLIVWWGGSRSSLTSTAWRMWSLEA